MSDPGVAVALLVGGLLAACGGGDGGAGRDDGAVVARQEASDTTGGAGASGASGVPAVDLDSADAAGAPAPSAPSTGDVGEAAGPAGTPSGVRADPSGAGSPGGRGAAESRDRAASETGGAPAAAPPESASRATTDEILRAASRAYGNLRSFRAQFDQELRNTLLGRTTRSSGTLYQRRPDRFLMDFSDPEGDLIVSDGEYFWMYFPSVDPKQVIRTSRGAQGLDLHAQFIGDPVARFDATYHGRESVRGRPADVLTLVPREPLGYRRMKVWIDTADHLARRFELTEQNENVRRLELGDLEINPALPDDLFQFTPPSDAIVVDRG